MKIFVGNLSFDATERDVKKAFEEFGSVASVAIVMDKKGTSSRGFGFVEMLDDQQAQAAISAFNGKDFMGRTLNVSPSVPKAKDKVEKREKKRGRIRGRVQSEEPVFGKESGYNAYKQGRRSRSFMTRRSAEGSLVQDRPRIKSHDNPLRWRNKSEQPKPWQKSQGESKPWSKSGGESRPWRKKEGESKPWQKSQGESRPWSKSGGESRPWRKRAGESKPWQKSQGESRPWKKRAESPKPWLKNNERPEESRSRGRKKPGVYNR
ncbi:MAG: hypothetical protein ABIH18_02230 [Candidatus Omnitrophota bacterium]